MKPLDPHNEALHATEPEEYQVIASPIFREWTVNGVTRVVGFCVNSPDAAGYCDDKALWIADQVTNPEHFLEYAIHEAMHGAFPDMPEGRVHEAAEAVAVLVAGVFRAKGAVLPTIKPLAPMAVARREGWGK